MITRTVRRFIDGRLRHRLKPLEEQDWTASAIIFAPHPDDETLGCGGIACKKIATGAQVRFVFVTDGAASHAAQVAPGELRAIREAEALGAVRRLGGTADSVTFLRFPDGEAIHHVDAIARAVARLVDAWGPDSVFVNHADDSPSDHVAVNEGVRSGLRICGRPVTVFEYPIWYWYHWPWARMRGDLAGMWRTTARQTFKTAAGFRAPFTLNAQAYVGDVLDLKRQALAEHVSQTQRPQGKDCWPVLADLSGGDFVARLFADYEAFTRYRINA